MSSTEPKVVTCPICLDRFPWDESEVLEYSLKDGKFNPARKPASGNPTKLADARQKWYVRCPNPSEDSPNHHLPATCADYPDPLVIALVGRPRSGKTHLVVAMIRELMNGMAAGCVQQVHPLDHFQHQSFHRNFLKPFERGNRLPPTPNDLGRYLTWLVVESGATKRPLVFFDVAGEDFLIGDGRSTRFLQGAGAVLVVEDSPHVFANSAEESDPSDGRVSGGLGASATNETVQVALSRLPEGGKHLPAAVTLTKSDRLRYQRPVDRWMRHDPGGRLSAKDLLAETRDVYALLHSVGATSMTKLYSDFERCTYHFVSATGGAVAGDGKFAAGIRPQRVLSPLLALLAMSGVITGPDAKMVGR
jgi:hypothetical protein